jgi:hypothetical protein
MTIAFNDHQYFADGIRPVWTNDAGSMAADTAKTRWPKTVQNMVEDVEQSAWASSDPTTKEEGLRIAEELKRIRIEIEGDERLK